MTCFATGFKVFRLEIGLTEVNLKSAYLDGIFEDRQTFPEKLSDTGAFSDLESLTPSEGIIPYDVNSPLWSDGAEKIRWISVPDGEDKINFSSDSSWTFPAGTVFIKHFEMAINEDSINRLETRFVIVYENSAITGISYKWNDEGSEAYLIGQDEKLEKELTLESNGGTSLLWKFPSRGECLECHNRNAGNILGVKTSQLNGEFLYPSTGTSDNQLQTWNHLALFDEDVSSVNSLPRLSNLSDNSKSIEYRIRSYLDANCSYCHRPDGVLAAFDARISTPLCEQSLVDEEAIGFYSENGSKVVDVGNYQSSEIWKRNNSEGEVRMPPLGTSVIDDEYVALLETWISTLRYDSAFDISACGTSYISPSGTHQWTSNGSHYDTLTDIHGCDSVLMIDLQLYQPELDSQLIELAAGDSLIWKEEVIKEAGTYIDTLSNVGGCDSIIVARVEILPVLRLQKASYYLDIYPNPSNNELHIRSTNPIPVNTLISVINLSGQVIEKFRTQDNNASQIKLNINYLASGTYLLTLEHFGQVHYLKFLKN